MVWFRVDDNLSDHPKVLVAGNASMGLWVRAGAWSMKHLTDGFVPDAVVALLGSARDVRGLVNSGLWIATDGGYRFHAWDGRQPTKEAVERDRDAASERQKRAREKARESRRDGGVSHSVSHGPPDPTRPDPIKEETPKGVSPAPSVLVGEFESAWKSWPKRVEKKVALEQFKRAAVKIPVAELVAAINKFGDAYAVTTERRYVPALGVWLRHERWTDELPTATTVASTQPQLQPSVSTPGRRDPSVMCPHYIPIGHCNECEDKR
jgi:hypothetical protein